MDHMPSRYAASAPVATAEGWTAARATPPARLFGANGIKIGPDGRIYVAQMSGSQISAVNPDTGEVETISPQGGGIVSPDDLVFDADGTMYCTELTAGRVSMMRPDGRTQVVTDNLPAANPITLHQGRLYAGECRQGGRIMELDRNGGAPRVIADGLPLPNAFEVGPDGKLYFPLIAGNAIWRVDLAGGEPEVVAGDLGRPDSARFDKHGFIVSTQLDGRLLRIDPRDGSREVIAQLHPGLDNCTFMGDRLFVSNVDGSLFEIGAAGAVRSILPTGLTFPLGLAAGASGEILVSDGYLSYMIDAAGRFARFAMFVEPGYPGFVRAIAPGGPGEWFCTTAGGEVVRWRPADKASDFLSTGHDRLMGVALDAADRPVVAEFGTGRVLAIGRDGAEELARNLDQPMGVAIAPDGNIYVSETGAGRVSRIARGAGETVLDDLGRPEGIVIAGGRIYVLDVAGKRLISADLDGGDRQTLAENLPVGGAEGAAVPVLGEIGGGVSGPLLRFAGLAATADGRIHIAADAEGSVITLRPA